MNGLQIISFMLKFSINIIDILPKLVKSILDKLCSYGGQSSYIADFGKHFKNLSEISIPRNGKCWISYFLFLTLWKE